MRTALFLSISLLSASVFATVIELKSGSSIIINAGDQAVVSCEGGNGSAGAEGAVSAFCVNGSTLQVMVDSAQIEDSISLDLSSSSVCKNALSKIKSKLGEFTGVKTFSFCDGNTMHKVKVDSAGTVTSSNVSFASSSECSNALN